MPKKITYTSEDLLDIRELFEAAVSIKDISNKYGTSETYMRNVLRTRYEQPLNRPSINRTLKPEDYLTIKERYKSGMLIKDIAKLYNMSYPGMLYVVLHIYNAKNIQEITASLFPCETIKHNIGKGHTLKSIAEALDTTELRIATVLRTKYNKSVPELREEGKLQIKEDILQHGFTTVTAYIEDNNISICPEYFRRYFNLSYGDIFNAKRAFKKCKIQEEYAKLCASTKKVVTTSQLKKLNPALGSLITYYFGSIRTLREAI